MLNRILALFRREPPAPPVSELQAMREALKPDNAVRAPAPVFTPPPKVKKRGQ